MTYLEYLASLGEDRFRLGPMNIYEDAVRIERERIRARVYAAAVKTWHAGEAYIGPPHWTVNQFVDALLEDGDADAE